MSPERIRNQPYSYMSDIWSFGLVIMECATGRYPFQETLSCIDMAQTILEAQIPELPSRQFSKNFRDFLKQCLRQAPEERLPAEVLLGSPWLQEHNVSNVTIAIDVVKKWIDSLSMK